MDKGIDLFHYLDILFYDHNFYMPNCDDNFNLETLK